jgi:hypothetical protein
MIMNIRQITPNMLPASWVVMVIVYYVSVLIGVF